MTPSDSVAGPFAEDVTQTRRSLNAADELVFPRHKSVLIRYTNDTSPVRELRLSYGDKEISFDEPDLFAFGETLGKQSRFVAGSATSWGGNDWPRVRDLLEQLIEEEVLHYADDEGTDPFDGLSHLPPAETTVARTWFECESVMTALTGRPLELGHLELVVPIFRVASVFLDGDGRQVGETNVFPGALRLGLPTQWRTCPYLGSRYQTTRPMNMTALKPVRTHWGQVMAMMLSVRAAYLARFPEARQGWTVGHLERLAVGAMALPTYLLMRGDRPIANGELHPALSSMFRIAAGLRRVTHQMQSAPISEPTIPPGAPMSSAEILAYAERNESFFGALGVCAGPQVMIQEFLSVVVDGQFPKPGLPAQLDAEVQVAIAQIEPALEYALLGLQATASVASLWPAMTRTYETLSRIADDWAKDGPQAVADFRDRLSADIRRIKTVTHFGSELWRVYEDMYGQCVLGLTGAIPSRPLSALLAPRPCEDAAQIQLRVALTRHFGAADSASAKPLDEMVFRLMDILRREQAIIRLACEVQGKINALLGRASPVRPFDGRDINLHNHLVVRNQQSRPPYLLEEIEEIFGLRIALTADLLEIKDASIRPRG